MKFKDSSSNGYNSRAKESLKKLVKDAENYVKNYINTQEYEVGGFAGDSKFLVEGLKNEAINSGRDDLSDAYNKVADALNEVINKKNQESLEKLKGYVKELKGRLE